jgi:hypothetical protein
MPLEDIEHDLIAQLKELMEDTDFTSPTDFADALAEELHGPQMKRALRLLLRTWVVRQISIEQAKKRNLQRMRVVTVPLYEDRQLKDIEGKPVAPKKNGGASKKVAAIRAQNHGWLRDRVSIGPGRSDWKFKGDLDYQDLLYVTKQRRSHAARLDHSADVFERLAQAVLDYGVEKVSDLPEHVLVTIGQM